jgi:DNA-directed RNA polymerase specialized sigma24 family protein
MSELSDDQLLAAWARDASQDAFAQLVRRHLQFVYAAALRQVRDPHLAEDVTQAVFILLSRKAARLRRGTFFRGGCSNRLDLPRWAH